MTESCSPRAASGTFPYNHRTVAAFDDLFGFRMGSKQERTRPALVNALLRQDDEGARGLQHRPGLPEAPCPNCGARGWCGHAGRIAA